MHSFTYSHRHTEIHTRQPTHIYKTAQQNVIFLNLSQPSAFELQVSVKELHGAVLDSLYYIHLSLPLSLSGIWVTVMCLKGPKGTETDIPIYFSLHAIFENI